MTKTTRVAGDRRARRACAQLLAAGLTAGAFTLLVGAGHLAAQVKAAEQSGTLPDGTAYRIQVPGNWNRTLIRDLDYASGALSAEPAWAARFRQLLDRGYALAGTSRHALRQYRYDPAREIADLDLVLDRFQARFGKPARVIQYGCSGGGHVGLAVAESFSDRIDGVIAMAAQTPVWIMNTSLDGWFVLKALVAPDLPVVNLSNEIPLVPIGSALDERFRAATSGLAGPLPAAWRRAIDAAQQTPEGRARIALAFTIGQWPPWVNRTTPQPNLDDVAALQHSMYHALYQIASNPGGQSRTMFENAALGQQLSWNTGVDYRELFENGNGAFKRAVGELYRQAGLDLQEDLGRVNAFPRVAASPFALDFWKEAGRTIRGTPKIPVLRMHEVGDPAVPLSLVQGYEEEVRANGTGDLVRTAFVNGDGHCQFNPAESAAAVAVLMRRLDTGSWPNTDPESLNTLAATFNAGPAPRFLSIDGYRQKTYNRAWRPD